HPARKSREAVLLADGVEPVVPAGEDFMTVGLVSDVPDQDVAGRVEDGVQRHRELHRTQAGCQVAAVRGDHLDDSLAHLLRELGERFGRQPLQIVGSAYRIKMVRGHGPPGGRKMAIENRTPIMAPTSTSSGVCPNSSRKRSCGGPGS